MSQNNNQHHHHRRMHHAAQHPSAAAADASGWVESISALSDADPATALLLGRARRPGDKAAAAAAAPAGPTAADGAALTGDATRECDQGAAATAATATAAGAAADAGAAAPAAPAAADTGDGDDGDDGTSPASPRQPAALSAEQRFDAALDHALGVVAAEVQGVGEAMLSVGAPDGWGPVCATPEARARVLERLTAAADAAGADVVVLREGTAEAPAPDGATSAAADGADGAAATAAAAGHTTTAHTADVVVRRRAGGGRSPVEVRVAVIGNVDSGKSTLVGVLTRAMLDDGRGLARGKVFKHHHEEATGRTSSIGQHNLCLDSKGRILNDAQFRAASCGEYVRASTKVVTLVDLAGHEKYFRTTAYGLTGHMPDYACLIVGANMGVVGMCKEHLGVALALKVPVFFVVTKVDICPEHVLKHTVQSLASILKKPGVRKRPYLVRGADDVAHAARHIASDALAPIFLTSAVTGKGLDLVRMFYGLLPQRTRWVEAQREAAEFVIDETFGVPGVGTVVAGTVKRGVITANTTSLLLGPDVGDGAFRPAAVKSIHFKRLPVAQVVAGQTAALALKKVKRQQVRKGMVLVDARLEPAATWEFDADVAVLTHATTIQPRYQAVIHCEIIRQAARVVAMDQERLRSGDRACVRFRFLQRPEYVTPGTRFVFREGRTKGVGVIVEAVRSSSATGAGAGSSGAVTKDAAAAAGHDGGKDKDAAEAAVVSPRRGGAAAKAGAAATAAASKERPAAAGATAKVAVSAG